MTATAIAEGALTWRDRVPRWILAALLMGALMGTTLLVAQLTNNWTIAPAAIFVGAMAGPLAWCVWVTDRTRIGRSVSPDILFIMFVAGGSVAMIFVGIFQSDFFYRPTAPGWLWIGLVEETAKVLLPFVFCTLVPRYRSVERALALALMSAGGFAVMESIGYAMTAARESVHAARNVLLERSLVTPFGHLPWTGIAVIVAATAWQERQRIVLSPKALWGFALAVVLHSAWNAVLVGRGWWSVVAIAIATVSFGTFYWLVSGVYYEGAYTVPYDHSTPRRPMPIEPEAAAGA